ncbi:MAG TPA: putative quinol monooxygenase [Lysobacter sp.]
MNRSPSIHRTSLIAAFAVWTTIAFASEPPVARYEAIPAGAYAVVAQVRAKAGKEDALRAITLPLVAQVRAEPNNLLYFLHEDRQAPGHFIFYEIFASQADFEAHNATPHVQAWFAWLPELAEGDVQVTRMEIRNNRGERSP